METKRVLRDGRVWTISRVRVEDAEEADFRFWYENLTPGERVNAVADATLSCLKTRGINELPRFRRVHRRIKCPWGSLRHRGSTRSSSLREASSDERS